MRPGELELILVIKAGKKMQEKESEKSFGEQTGWRVELVLGNIAGVLGSRHRAPELEQQTTHRKLSGRQRKGHVL